MFENRQQAGEELAIALQGFADQSPVVYALPRGGLPVAAAVADALHAPLDLILVRKIGAPGRKELAIGAVVDGAHPTLIRHEEMISSLYVDEDYIDKAKKSLLHEIERRRALYFTGHEPISPTSRTAIIVDDGLATGATMEAAIEAVRKATPKAVVVAVPTAPQETIARLQGLADKVVCLETPAIFISVGEQYRHFPQLSDEDVVRIMGARDKRKNGNENLVRKFS